ncbi:hypothetical protein FHL15_005107 [Xylaria flabelliformis]|uniref:Uncharacterized protein n=1 Tax=Xylaria flabelliformis TaxID=2512241 RepID=A0A553I1F5_9PEZI|nr:hypothetical protein FHL15_005107 [Xylaria flabelliformis]
MPGRALQFLVKITTSSYLHTREGGLANQSDGLLRKYWPRLFGNDNLMFTEAMKALLKIVKRSRMTGFGNNLSYAVVLVKAGYALKGHDVEVDAEAVLVFPELARRFL